MDAEAGSGAKAMQLKEVEGSTELTDTELRELVDAVARVFGVPLSEEWWRRELDAAHDQAQRAWREQRGAGASVRSGGEQ